MRIKARPTTYCGTLFRSRLEATWAAFFDIAGLPWAYEPIDFEGWVPDFVLFLQRPVYVEVKPVPLQVLRLDWGGQKPPALLPADRAEFEKAKMHQKDVNVLLLGLRPNDDADFFGIGNLMDLPDDLGAAWRDPTWWALSEELQVKDANRKWGAALAATQWVPA